MEAIVRFLADTEASFMVNAYPCFAYGDNPSTINLEYTLLGNSTSSFIRDPKSYVYTNMLDAHIDAVCSTINGLGFENGGNYSVGIRIAVEWKHYGHPVECEDLQHKANRTCTVH